ncbi:MAG: hypothetical protein M1814_003445 [Vezdaea aestivalis]|nr:MAG: hypothetical protein M1814_003445 [Vezdaea aestivalis]
MALGSQNIDNYRQRYDHLTTSSASFEEARNDLIDELINQVERLDSEFQRERLDLTREAAWNRDGQVREEKLKQQIHHLKEEVRLTRAMMDRNPFILILIDGDGMLFTDDFLKFGEQGGREAAKKIHNIAQDYIALELPKLSNYRIIARVYANLKGLADALYRAGVIEHQQKMIEFARGFTSSKPLFDFIDVGTGKDRADSKMTGQFACCSKAKSHECPTEQFKLNVYDCHCKQILFGCSHDNGYARVLEEYTSDVAAVGRVALLRGVPFEREIARLQEHFKTMGFEGLFRETKLVVHSPINRSQAPAVVSQLVAPIITRSVSTNSNGSATSGAYAAAAALPPPPKSATPPLSAQTAGPLSVPRNRYGQRIDPVLQYDRNTIKQVRGLKLCNSHFLRGDCPYDPCSHDHFYKPSKAETNTLRYIARMAPCRHGSACSDVRCIYGHCCPAGDPCAFGDSCRFPDDMHNMDTNVVRAIKV